MSAAPRRVALIGRYGPPQIACIRSWLDAGLVVGFYHLADRGRLRFTPKRLAHYWPLSAGFVTLPDAAARLRGQLEKWDAWAAVSYRELAFLRGLSGVDAPEGVVCAPSAAALDFLIAKLPQISLAAEVGMAVLPTWTLTTPACGARVPADVFPIVIRPDTDTSATPAFKAEKIATPAELEAALARFRPGFTIVAQPYAHGPNLVVHGGRAADGAQSEQRAFLVDWKYEGVTQRLKPVPLDPALDRQCAAFVAAMGLVGVYHFEFLAVPDGPPLFLEINGRFGGTTAKVRLAGFDEPMLQLRCHGALPWSPDPGRARAVSATNRLGLIKRLAGLRRTPSPLDYPVAGRATVAAGLLGGLAGWSDEVMSARHWRTTLDFYRETAA